MAAALVTGCARSASFKTLSLQAWGLRRLPSIYLSTKPVDSEKGSLKDKGEVIINSKPDATIQLTDEDLRKLLAKKTLVMFPQKAQFSFEKEPVFSSTEGLRKKSTDEESFSSSSSESDSDSEDDYFKKKPYRQKERFWTTDNKQLESDIESDMMKTASKQRPTETYLKSKNLEMAIAESQKPTKVLSGSLEVSSSEADPQRTHLVPSQNISQNLRWDESLTKEVQKTEMQDRTEEPGGEVSPERMPVTDTTLKEQIIPEAGAQIEEQSTPQEVKPSPVQETHDISTYKNLQHHEYQPFTFVDFDVLLSKFRLPQPSSGRLSPRH